MNYSLTISNGTKERTIFIAGSILDSEWKERQQIAEDKFAKSAPPTMHRVHGKWIIK